MDTIKKLLVPTDLSPASTAATHYAVDLASRLGAAVHFLHVVEQWDMTASYVKALAIELPGLHERVVESAEQALSAMVAGLASRVATTAEVREGRPAALITEVACERHIDLIVMGTHGRSGVEHALIGSVAERVVRTAPCPVLTVRGSLIG